MSKLIGAAQTATLGDKITTFTSSGTFTPVKSAVDFLVVAGGGGGSSRGAGSGGGGAGGFRASYNNETSGGLGDSQSILSLTAGTTYTIIVGAGGAGQSSNSGPGSKGTGSFISNEFLDSDSDTEFLLHSNTTNGSTTFTDSSSAGQTISSYGDAQHSTTEKKFGTTAIKFDGTGDYLTVPSIPNFDNYSAYCIEMWVNTSATYGYLLHNKRLGTIGDNQNAGMRLSVGNIRDGDDPGKVVWIETMYAGSDHTVTSSSRVDDGEWHHIAATRGTQNNPVKLYIDGVHETSGTTANQNFDSSRPLYIGRSTADDDYFTGYIEEIRISDDTNRYTTDFTPTGTPHVESFGGGSGSGQGGAGSTTNGSGGGGAYGGAGRSGTANQGFDGGTAVYFGGNEYTGGAGGGAGGVGLVNIDLSPGMSGEGGPGQFSTISGQKIYYAGGGGGGSYIYGGPGARSATGGGGYGLGGDWFQGGSSLPHVYYGGTNKNAESASANTGGGGGGGDGATTDDSNGGAGGSGIVITREADVRSAGGVWSMKQVYKERTGGNW